MFKWKVSFVQEAGSTLGACTGKGKYHKSVPFDKILKKMKLDFDIRDYKEGLLSSIYQ